MKSSQKAALVAILLILSTTLFVFWSLDSPAPNQLQARIQSLNNQLSQHYVLYCEAFSKNYNSKEEFEMRKNIFIDRLHSICDVNSEVSGACKLFAPNTTAFKDADAYEQELGLNERADWTEQELSQSLNNFYTDLEELSQDDVATLDDAAIEQYLSGADHLEALPSHHPHVLASRKEPPPVTLDWREHNAVTPVRSQGLCGSCWAFATVAALESSYAIKNGKQVEFSEQQILDCVSKSYKPWYQSQSCSGGYPREAMQFGSESYLSLRKNYPYKGLRAFWQECQMDGFDFYPRNLLKKGFFTQVKDAFLGPQVMSSWVQKPTKIEEELFRNGELVKVDKYYKVENTPEGLKKALQLGPVVILMDASQLMFEFYRGGIISHKKCKKELNHAVTAIGYGRELSKDPRQKGKWNEYFIIKNSWGKSWGEKGYARLSAASEGNDWGTCGMLKYGNYIGFVKDASNPERFGQQQLSDDTS